jgi:hypothetical protein
VSHRARGPLPRRTGRQPDTTSWSSPRAPRSLSGVFWNVCFQNPPLRSARRTFTAQPARLLRRACGSCLLSLCLRETRGRESREGFYYLLVPPTDTHAAQRFFLFFPPTNSDLFPKRRNQPIPFGGNPYSNGRAFSSLLLARVRKLNSLSLPPRLVQGFTARVAYRFRFFTMSSKTSVLAVLVVVFAAFPAVKAACGQLSGGACNVGSSKTMCSSVNSVGTSTLSMAELTTIT